MRCFQKFLIVNKNKIKIWKEQKKWNSLQKLIISKLLYDIQGIILSLFPRNRTETE